MLWRRSRRTRSAEADVEPAVRRDGDPLALAHEHRGCRRLEDRRALELLPDGERVHPVNGHLDPVAEPDATASGRRGRPSLGRAGTGRQHGERADDRHARVDDDDFLARGAVGVELLVTAVEAIGHPIHEVRHLQVNAAEVYLDLEDLLAVPHVEGSAHADGPVEVGEALAAFALECGEQLSQARRRRASHLAHVGAPAVTWSPAAPPNATSANWRGSTPRPTETILIPSAMLVFTTRAMPSAAWRGVVPSWVAMTSTAARAARASSPMRPPRKFPGSRKPSTRFASVTVARAPPLP